MSQTGNATEATAAPPLLRTKSYIPAINLYLDSDNFGPKLGVRFKEETS